MLMLAMCSVMWREIFPDMSTKGKVLLLPFFAFASLSFVLGGVVEFFLIDIPTMFIFSFSRSMEISDFFEYLQF